MSNILKISLFFCITVICGCASFAPIISFEVDDVTAEAKQFNPPSEGMAGLYIYRIGVLGSALKKDIYVDGKCIGASISDVFFYYEVPGNRDYIIATESEFSPNELKISVESGKIYFIEQYIKFGIYQGGANLRVIEPEIAKEKIRKLKMAVADSYCYTSSYTIAED